MSDLSTYLDYGSTEISDDLNPERARQPEKQEPSNERKKMLADSLSTALEYGRRLAVEEGLYPHEGDWMHADIPDNDIILGANDWLLDQTGFTYDEFVDGMESTGLSDAVEWAWSLQGEPTVQLDVAHMARQGNPWQFVWDVGSNALGAAGSLLAGDLGGARDAWTEKEGHMYGYAPNPYGSQVGNALGVHNWADAGFALLDLADIASFGMQGMIIAPIRSAAANAQMRLGNHEIARIMGGKRMREEFAEQAARAADTEMRTIPIIRALNDYDGMFFEPDQGTRLYKEFKAHMDAHDGPPPDRYPVNAEDISEDLTVYPTARGNLAATELTDDELAEALHTQYERMEFNEWSGTDIPSDENPNDLLSEIYRRFASKDTPTADTELRTIWDNISTGEREVIEADYRAAFPDADPDPADMMRWYEQQGPPGTPEARPTHIENINSKTDEEILQELKDVGALGHDTGGRIVYDPEDADRLWGPVDPATGRRVPEGFTDLKGNRHTFAQLSDATDAERAAARRDFTDPAIHGEHADSSSSRDYLAKSTGLRDLDPDYYGIPWDDVPIHEIERLVDIGELSTFRRNEFIVDRTSYDPVTGRHITSDEDAVHEALRNREGPPGTPTPFERSIASSVGWPAERIPTRYESQAILIERLGYGFDEHPYAEFIKDPLFREFVEMAEKTRLAEKDPLVEPFSDELLALWDPTGPGYRTEGWEHFSRLRGYTEEEIADFRRYLEVEEQLSAKYPDDPDFTFSIVYGLRHQPGPPGTPDRRIGDSPEPPETSGFSAADQRQYDEGVAEARAEQERGLDVPTDEQRRYAEEHGSAAEEGGWSEELKAKRQQEYLDEIRLDPESFWEETPHGTASLAELGWMSWQQLFDVMRNTRDSLYDFAQEEFMQRYNLLRKLRDEGRLPPLEGTGSLPLHEIDKANIERFLRHFPDGTYPPETFEDLLVASMDPDLRGTSPIPQELVDSVSEIAREMDEWWEDSIIRNYQQRQQGPPGTPERDPLDRRPGPEQRRPYPDTYTPDEVDEIVRNEGGLTDKEIRDLMDDPPGPPYGPASGGSDVPDPTAPAGTPTGDADRLASVIRNDDGLDLFEYWKAIADESGYTDSIIGSEAWKDDLWNNDLVDSAEGLYMLLRDKTGPIQQHFQSPEMHQIFQDIRDFASKRLDELERAAPTGHSVTKIISGGQTGADVGGLLAGRDLGLETGGWIPEGFLTEGTTRGSRVSRPDLGEQFGLREAPHGPSRMGDDYRGETWGYDYPSSHPWGPRTLANAAESDGTLWIGTTTSAGYGLTKKGVKAAGGHMFFVNLANIDNLDTRRKFMEWLAQHDIQTLNVAGNRQLSNKGIDLEAETRRFLNETLGGG